MVHAAFYCKKKKKILMHLLWVWRNQRWKIAGSKQLFIAGTRFNGGNFVVAWPRYWQKNLLLSFVFYTNIVWECIGRTAPEWVGLWSALESSKHFWSLIIGRSWGCGQRHHDWCCEQWDGTRGERYFTRCVHHATNKLKNTMFPVSFQDDGSVKATLRVLANYH